MVTVKISIKAYLARYMYVRYEKCLKPESGCVYSPLANPVPIHLLPVSPVYHFLHQLSVSHPKHVSWRMTGNIAFVLPKPRHGKNPDIYNYIGQESALEIEREIEVEMRMELFEFLLENKFRHGVMFKKSLEQFIERYRLEELVEEGTLMKAFQRWRKKVREEREKEY